MAVERIHHALDGIGGCRFGILFGVGIDDIYFSEKFGEINIEQALIEELRYLQYDRIIFYSPHRSIYTLDSASRELISHKELASQNQDSTTGYPRMKRLSGGPLRDLLLLPKVNNSDNGYSSEGMSDIFAIRRLDTFMRDESDIRSAIVFVQAESSLRYFEDARILAGIIGEWTRLPSKNRNICIFLFAANNLENLNDLAIQIPVPEVREWLTVKGGGSQTQICISNIKGPDRDEVRNMIECRQRAGDSSVDPKQVEHICQWIAHEGGRAKDWWRKLQEVTQINLETARKYHWFPAFQQRDASALVELHSLIGLDDVKNRIDELTAWIKIQVEKDKQGKKKSQPLLNFIFTGNPGTGKTTVARLIGEIFLEVGILERGHLVEVTGSDLIAEHVGGTAIKTNQVIDQAVDGVLFIDEAYVLTERDRGGFGQEAIDTLLVSLEEKRKRLVVILAGYPQKMDQLVRSNPGLARRFPKDNRFMFPDYSPEELSLILDHLLEERDLICTGVVHKNITDLLSQMTSIKDDQFGNAGEVRNLVDSIERRLSMRVVQHKGKPPFKVQIEDIPEKYREYLPTPIPDVEIVLSQLNGLIGLEDVKSYFTTLVKRVQFEKLNAVVSTKTTGFPLQHLVFLGNPGTGKTTAARLLGQIYQSLGLLQKGHCIEVNRADFVAGYVGQTALKTREKILEALDGVLFVDEAYSFGDGSEQDYAKEAIATMIEMIDKYRGRLVVVVAGYSEKMEHFLNINPGLRSRFLSHVHFPDFTSSELIKILSGLASKEGYQLSKSVQLEAIRYLERMRDAEKSHFGNARSVYYLYEEMKNSLAKRVMDGLEKTGKKVASLEEATFIKADVPKLSTKKPTHEILPFPPPNNPMKPQPKKQAYPL